MKAVNILWDLEEGESDYALPKEVELPEKFESDDYDYDDVVDYLSDEYGFCILRCDIVTKEDESTNTIKELRTIIQDLDDNAPIRLDCDDQCMPGMNINATITSISVQNGALVINYTSDME